MNKEPLANLEYEYEYAPLEPKASFLVNIHYRLVGKMLPLPWDNPVGEEKA